MVPQSIDHIADVLLVRGAQAPAEAAPALVIEVPHGATESEDYHELAARLRSPLPADLDAFFHVNTDAGAPELAAATAERWVELHPERVALVVRCRVPRTFIDCNRAIDATADDFRAGGVTPGMGPWITEAVDRELLLGRYRAYMGLMDEALALAAPGHALLLLHTFAPRTVDVQVSPAIVADLRAAWAPERVEASPLRPDIEVLSRDVDGRVHAPPGAVAALRDAFAPTGLRVADSETWTLHPSTLALRRAIEHPGRTLCIEFRRDHLVRAWTPLRPLQADPSSVARLAGPLAASLVPGS